MSKLFSTISRYNQKNFPEFSEFFRVSVSSPDFRRRVYFLFSQNGARFSYKICIPIFEIQIYLAFLWPRRCRARIPKSTYGKTGTADRYSISPRCSGFWICLKIPLWFWCPRRRTKFSPKFRTKLAKMRPKIVPYPSCDRRIRIRKLIRGFLDNILRYIQFYSGNLYL